MTIGERLKKVRKAKKLTQGELAKLTGISESAIRKYEIGVRNARPEQLYRLAKALECTLDYLLEKTDDPEEFVIDLTKSVKGGTTKVRNDIKKRIGNMSDEKVIAWAILLGLSTEKEE